MTSSEAVTTEHNPAFDTLSFRDALGHFATGVTIITAMGRDGTPVGVTVNSFNSASLDPPLVLWSLNRSSGTLPVFSEAGSFVVHILSAEQIELSNRFARPADDKFDGIEFGEGLGGAPLLAGCAARFECRTMYQYEGGDHIIFVGEVQRFDQSGGATLLFHKGRYALSAEQRKVESAGEGADPRGGFIDDYLAYLLIDASRAFLSRFRDCVHAAGLDLPGWRTLANLTDQDGRKGATMLRKGAAEDAESLLACHDELESAGLIWRHREEGVDPMQWPVHLTEQGRERVIPVLAAAKSLEADALSGLASEAERESLKSAMRKIAAVLGQSGEG